MWPFGWYQVPLKDKWEILWWDSIEIDQVYNRMFVVKRLQLQLLHKHIAWRKCTPTKWNKQECSMNWGRNQQKPPLVTERLTEISEQRYIGIEMWKNKCERTRMRGCILTSKEVSAMRAASDKTNEYATSRVSIEKTI